MCLPYVPYLLTKVRVLGHENEVRFHQSSVSRLVKVSEAEQVKDIIPDFPKVNFFANGK